MKIFKHKQKNTFFPHINNSGFSSLAEITLVLGILTVLFLIGIVSFPRYQQSASISAVVDTFLADFKEQQIKAMTGDTEGGSSPENYGIHFDTTNYTLFRGTWSPSDPDNFTIRLPASIEVTTTFDILGEKEIIFLKGSGEVASWNPSYAITFRDISTNVQKTIQVERSGAFTLN